MGRSSPLVQQLSLKTNVISMGGWGAVFLSTSAWWRTWRCTSWDAVTEYSVHGYCTPERILSSQNMYRCSSSGAMAKYPPGILMSLLQLGLLGWSTPNLKLGFPDTFHPSSWGHQLCGAHTNSSKIEFPLCFHRQCSTRSNGCTELRTQS